MNINLRGGFTMIQSQLFGFMSSKGFFWTLALGWMTGPVIYMLVWITAAGSGVIGGYDRNDFLVYYLFLIMANQFTYTTSHWSTAEMIHNGSVSSTLLRPLPFVYGAISTDLATKVVCLPFAVAVVRILGLLFQIQFSLTATTVGIAFMALLLSLLLRFMVGYIISIMAFYTQQVGSLLAVNDTLVFLFAGQVAPLAIFPNFLQKIVLLLPYRYMISFPIEILTGKLTGGEIKQGILIQLAYIVILFVVHHIVFQKGVKRYSAIGG